MAKNTDNILIFGGDDAAFFLGPKGTTGPVGLATPASPYKDAGWLSDEGTTLAESVENQNFYAHQGGTLVASVVTNEEKTLQFQCYETTALQLGLRWPGFTPAAVSGSTGVYGGEVKTGQSTQWSGIYDDYAINQFLPDGKPIQERYVLPRVMVSDKADLVFKRDQIRIWEFTMTIIGNFFFYSNNPALAPAA